MSEILWDFKPAHIRYKIDLQNLINPESTEDVL